MEIIVIISVVINVILGTLFALINMRNHYLENELKRISPHLYKDLKHWQFWK